MKKMFVYNKLTYFFCVLLYSSLLINMLGMLEIINVNQFEKKKPYNMIFFPKMVIQFCIIQYIKLFVFFKLRQILH